ncbi:conserved hypothetical protein [Ricinus communis]|uniref:Bet v I/Major latex protein domain-containing protein n=1 Tax=Ricinus communis TaxID=3988 RepID=B9T645_RICCO|nr:conserved hypothetical protein [Ricinus communis]
MVKEVKTQAKIGVGVDILWKALAKNLKFIIPKMIPNLVKDAEVIEGDGGLGTVYLFNFGPDIKTMTYQKEKISELDDSLHRIALQLTAIGEGETLIDVTVAYESEIEDDTMPSKTKSSTLAYISSLENYLANASSC